LDKEIASLSCADLVAKKIWEIMGPNFSHIDYILAIYLHLDHIGYAVQGGIWALLENHGFTVGKLTDRDSGVWGDKNNDGICDHETEIQWKNTGTKSGTGDKWLCYVTDPANASKVNHKIAVS
jgi:hypothetical protein